MNREKIETGEEILKNVLVSKEEISVSIPNNWIYFYFTSLLDVKGGTQPPKNEFVSELEEGYERLIQIRDFTSDNYKVFVPNNNKLRKVNENDILIARYGASLGKILTGLEGAYNVALTKVVFKPELFESKYLYWLLKSSHFQIPLTKISRSAQSGFNKKDLSYIPLPLPPLKEQKRIVNKIEGLLDKVDKSQQLIEEAKETFGVRRDAILKKAFNGELTQKWRKENFNKESSIDLVKKLTDESVGSFDYSKAIIDENLPKGWIYIKLEDIFTITGGGTPKKTVTSYWNGDLPWVTPKDMKRLFIENSINTITEEGVKNSAAKIVKENSVVLVVRSGILKRALPVSYLNRKSTVNQDMKVFNSFSKEVNEYLLWYIHGNQKKLLSEYSKSGTTVDSLNFSEFKTHLLPLPPFEELKVIINKINETIKKEDSSYKHIENLELIQLMKQSILNKAFRGELGTNNSSEQSLIPLLKEIYNKE